MVLMRWLGGLLGRSGRGWSPKDRAMIKSLEFSALTAVPPREKRGWTWT